MYVVTTRICLFLVTLELWLPDKLQFCCIFAATKDKFDYFLKKLFHSSTSHTYHHNSSLFLNRHKNIHVAELHCTGHAQLTCDRSKAKIPSTFVLVMRHCVGSIDSLPTFSSTGGLRKFWGRRKNDVNVFVLVVRIQWISEKKRKKQTLNSSIFV